MGSQSGISATERASVKQSLGLSEKYSTWRDDLREVVDVPEKDTDADKVIKEKKVKNKIVINPPMKEAFEEIGATVIEAVELEEMDNADEAESQKKKQLQVKGQMLKKQQMLDRMRLQMQKQGKLPTGHAEGYAPGDVDQKVGAVTAIPKKDQDDAKARILAKAAAKRKAKGVKEATEDSLRDRRMERGGVDGNNRYDRAPSNTPNTFGKKKPASDGMSALEKVKASIRAKHGDGAIKEDAKMAKQSDEKLAALHKQVSSSDQSLPSNQFMMKRVTKEMNRRKKAT
jgi:hypothetical protein